MDPITLAALAFGSAILLGGKKRRSSASSGTRVVSPPSGWVAKTKEERAHWLHEIENMSRWVSNKYGTMPHLSNYLVITSFRGAKFNPGMVNAEIAKNPNAARGLFDMRPSTVEQYIPAIGDSPELLNNPYISFTVAIQHIIRAVSKVEQKGSGVPDWISIRRWWTYPYLVHDFDESEEVSKKVRDRMMFDVDDCNEKWGTDINPDFWDYDVNVGGAPPTPQALMQDFGLAGAAAS